MHRQYVNKIFKINSLNPIGTEQHAIMGNDINVTFLTKFTQKEFCADFRNVSYPKTGMKEKCPPHTTSGVQCIITCCNI